MLERKLSDVCGIGPKTVQKLAGMNIHSIEALQGMPLHILTAAFHSYGTWLYHAARGEDDNPVAYESEAPKSFGHAHTLPHNTRDPDTMRCILFGLAEKVARRMRREGFSAETVSVTIRYGDFQTVSVEERCRTPMHDGLVLGKVGWRLCKQARDKTKPVRLLGLSAGGLVAGRMMPLFLKDQKTERVVDALDALSHKRGRSLWSRAGFMNN